MSSDDVDEEPLPLPEDWNGEPRFVIFVIPSPQSLPLPHGLTIAIAREEFVPWMVGGTLGPTDGSYDPATVPVSDGTNIVSLRVWRPFEKVAPDIRVMDNAMMVANQLLKRPQPTDPRPELPTSDSGATVFEAVTALLPVRKDDGTIDVIQSVSDAFDRCLDSISELVRAYVVASHDVQLEPITRQTLPVSVPWTTREPEAEGDRGGIGIFLVNEGLSSIARVSKHIDPELLNKVLILLSRLKRRDPFLGFAERMRSSRRAYLYKGDYLAAVIDAHTASEVLFDPLLLLMAWEENVRPEVAASWFDERLAKRLRTHYGSRLGGGWNTGSATGVLGRWARDVRDVRDACLHKGQTPSDVEARTAIECMESVDNFVRARLAASASTYPRTTLLLLGRPGLERLGAYSGFIEEFARTNSYNEPDWIAWYRTWADDFEKERARR